MITIYAKHEPYEDGTLGNVYSIMQIVGAPIIRVRQIDDAFYALEGSHRLASAYEMRLEPKLFVVEPDLSGDPYLPVELPRYDFEHAYIIGEKDFQCTLASEPA